MSTFCGARTGVSVAQRSTSFDNSPVFHSSNNLEQALVFHALCISGIHWPKHEQNLRVTPKSLPHATSIGEVLGWLSSIHDLLSTRATPILFITVAGRFHSSGLRLQRCSRFMTCNT